MLLLVGIQIVISIHSNYHYSQCLQFIHSDYHYLQHKLIIFLIGTHNVFSINPDYHLCYCAYNCLQQILVISNRYSSCPQQTLTPYSVDLSLSLVGINNVISIYSNYHCFQQALMLLLVDIQAFLGRHSPRPRQISGHRQQVFIMPSVYTQSITVFSIHSCYRQQILEFSSVATQASRCSHCLWQTLMHKFRLF